MKNTTFESAADSQQFASTESAAKKNISLNGRYSSMEEFVEKLSTEMLFHKYIHAIEWQNTARSSRVLVSVEAQDVYSSCESWNVEIYSLDHPFNSDDLANAWVMANNLLKEKGLSHNCQLRGVEEATLPEVKRKMAVEAIKNLLNKVDFGYGFNTYCKYAVGIEETIVEISLTNGDVYLHSWILNGVSSYAPTGTLSLTGFDRPINKTIINALEGIKGIMRSIHDDTIVIRYR